MCNNSENAEAAGTPVIGLGAALEIISFFRHLVDCSGKRAILF